MRLEVGEWGYVGPRPNQPLTLLPYLGKQFIIQRLAGRSKAKSKTMGTNKLCPAICKQTSTGLNGGQ